MKVSKFVLNNLEDFVWDSHANHVIRTVTECLGGISSAAVAGNYKKHTQPKIKIAEPSIKNKIPPEYSELLKELVHRLSAWPQFQGWYPTKAFVLLYT
jgi:nucleolar protein 9